MEGGRGDLPAVDGQDELVWPVADELSPDERPRRPARGGAGEPASGCHHLALEQHIMRALGVDHVELHLDLLPFLVGLQEGRVIGVEPNTLRQLRDREDVEDARERDVPVIVPSHVFADRSDVAVHQPRTVAHGALA